MEYLHFVVGEGEVRRKMEDERNMDGLRKRQRDVKGCYVS